MRSLIIVSILVVLALGSMALSLVILDQKSVQAQGGMNVKIWKANDPPAAVRALLAAPEAMPGTQALIEGSLDSMPSKKKLGKFSLNEKTPNKFMGVGFKKKPKLTSDKIKTPKGLLAFTSPKLKGFNGEIKRVKRQGMGTAVTRFDGSAKRGAASFKYKVKLRNNKVEDFRIKKVKQGAQGQ